MREHRLGPDEHETASRFALANPIAATRGEFPPVADGATMLQFARVKGAAATRGVCPPVADGATRLQFAGVKAAAESQAGSSIRAESA
jgi:hypothetical protein